MTNSVVAPKENQYNHQFGGCSRREPIQSPVRWLLPKRKAKFPIQSPVRWLLQKRTNTITSSAVAPKENQYNHQFGGCSQREPIQSPVRWLLPKRKAKFPIQSPVRWLLQREKPNFQ